jgi:predicted PurR-regulated permease PerM
MSPVSSSRASDLLRAAAAILLLYAAARLLWLASPLFLTGFLGLLFGLALSSGVDQLVRWRVPRGAGAALIVAAIALIFYGFGAWLAPTIHAQGLELRHRLPDAIDRAENWIDARRGGAIGMVFGGASAAAHADSSVAATPGLDTAAAATNPTANGAATPAGRTVAPSMDGLTRYLFPFLSSTIQIITGVIIILFLSIYIAVDPGVYHRGILHLVPHRRRPRVREVMAAVGGVLRRWLVAQFIAMITLGVVTTAILLVLHVRAAFALGLLSALLEFIPTLGPIVSALPAMAMGFLDSPEKALWVAVAYVGVHFVEGHLLIPLLMKGGLKLPPALTIFSEALMALLFGFLGLMCAVPLCAATLTAVKMLYVHDVVGDPGFGADEDPQRGIAP